MFRSIRRATPVRALAVLTAAALLAAGCSSGNQSSSSGSGSSDASNTSALTPAVVDKVVGAYKGDLAELPKTFGDDAPKKALKIGWSSANDGNELVKALGESIKKATEAKGGSLTAYDAAADVPQQVSQMQQLVSAGVDAIIVWPLDSTALAPVVKQAKEAGIPVIGMEATPDAHGDIGDMTGQIIYGRDMQAYVTANLMAELHPGAEIFVSKFAVPVPSIAYYAERAKAYAEEAGLKVVGIFDNPSDTVAGAEGMAGPVLSANQNVVGSINFNDPDALGTQAAAKAAGRTLTSFGNNGEASGVDGVKSGRIALTIQPPVVDWGKQLVNGAYLAAEGGKVAKVVYTGVGTVITKANVDTAKTMQEVIAGAKYGG